MQETAQYTQWVGYYREKKKTESYQLDWFVVIDLFKNLNPDSIFKEVVTKIQGFVYNFVKSLEILAVLPEFYFMLCTSEQTKL